MEPTSPFGDGHARAKVAVAGTQRTTPAYAVRAYRALAAALRTQGLGTEATRYLYRVGLVARYEQVYDFWTRLRSRHFYAAPAAFGRWLVSWLLGTFAGYGHRLGRLFVVYLVMVTVFAGLMFALADRPPRVAGIRDVYVLSITSFHGRRGLPLGLHLSDALATLAAAEAGHRGDLHRGLHSAVLRPVSKEGHRLRCVRALFVFGGTRSGKQ